MAASDSSFPRADQIYRTGPESLIAESSAIVTGPVSNYSKSVLALSQPGADGFPLRWVVSGHVDRPQALKGQAPPGTMPFSRSEQSGLVPTNEPAPSWEATYGELAPQEPVVLFLGEGQPKPLRKALPSGPGERDLITLVRDVVPIQGIMQADQRVQRWLAYLTSAPAEEGRKAALRSLIAIPVAWADLEPVLDPFVRNAKLSHEVRAFGFGIVAFAVGEEKWGSARDAAVGFLCRVFSAEGEPRLATQYLYGLGQMLTYCADEDFRQQRKPVRDQIVDCLQRRPALALSGGPSVRPDREQHYQQMRAQYLAR